MQEIISEFAQCFTRYAQQIAVIDPRNKRQFSYAEMEDLSSRLAELLRPRVRNGARVALLLGNEIEIALCYLACLQLQVTAVPIHTALHRNEVKHTLDFAMPELLISTSTMLEKFGGAGVPTFCFGEREAFSIEDLKDLPRLHVGCFGALKDDFLALIMFTSGSTGVPKAIPVLFSCLVGSVFALRDTQVFGTASRYYSVLPMSYIGGIHLMLCHFGSGGVFILDEAFSPRSMYRYWDTVLTYQADSLWITPSMAASLLALGLEDEACKPVLSAQITRVVIFMGAISDEAMQRFEAVFGLRVQKALGITEALLCCHWNDDLDTPRASVGKALPGVEIFIADTHDKQAPVGQEGEIRVGGKWVFAHYWQQDAITADSFDAQGYFKTGDLGSVDEEGHVFITGRIKDMIKCGGLNVAPAEIEAMLCRLEDVKEAAVVGVPDAFYGERIIAFVHVMDGATLDEENMKAFCRQHLTAQKVPSEIRMRKVFPMNAVGKVDKKKLKAELLGGGVVK